ncbi:MAG: flavodoxin family protein [Lachnospiraceae bacterium]|nr:flavodoxin family protein [Lachnospiraceae bacterium]
MKIVILNGSPRKGNTLTAINAFAEGAKQKNDIEIIDTYRYKISPCMGCEACECSKGCVAKDDSNMIIDKLVVADMIVFASPVYWWGITAQIKLVIDKAYCRASLLKDKKVGVIIVGGSSVDNEQYKLIRGQFRCISEYLNWNIIFHEDYSAYETGDLAENVTAIEELKAIGTGVSQ